MLQSLACQLHLFWETLCLGSFEVALYIPFPLTFVLVGRPCLTGELSQMVEYEQGGGRVFGDLGIWGCVGLPVPQRGRGCGALCWAERMASVRFTNVIGYLLFFL